MWVGGRVNLGKGGRVLGKRTGFAHMEPASTRLDPDKSTQVVDFPRMYAVRAFSGGLKFGFTRQAGHGSRAGTSESARRAVRNYVGLPQSSGHDLYHLRQRL